jgi:hypothetical protein
MTAQTLILLGVTASIFLSVLAMGMRIIPAELRYLRGRPNWSASCSP